MMIKLFLVLACLGTLTQGYEFTTDWFSAHIPQWQRYTSYLTHLPSIQILEVGSWEGRSALWMAQNLLQAEGAHLDCVDTWQGSIENTDPIQNADIGRKFKSNLKEFIDAGKVKQHIGKSGDILPKLFVEGRKYDFIYIDGSHEAADVQLDANLAFMMLKPGGRIIFDDYVGADTSKPKIGIDGFLTAYANRLMVLAKYWQLVIMKI